MHVFKFILYNSNTYRDVDVDDIIMLIIIVLSHLRIQDNN